MTRFAVLVALIALALSTLVFADEKEQRHYVDAKPSVTETTGFQALAQSIAQIEAKERELAEAKKQVRDTYAQMCGEAAAARGTRLRLHYDLERNAFFSFAAVQSADGADVAPVESGRIPNKRERLHGHKPK